MWSCRSPMISSPLSPMPVRLAGKLCTVDGGPNRPGANGGGAQAAKGSRAVEVWKTVHLFVPSDRTASEVSRYLQDHINAVAYEAGEYVRQVRRQLNAALHRIAMTQARLQPPARELMQRRQLNGRR